MRWFQLIDYNSTQKIVNENYVKSKVFFKDNKIAKDILAKPSKIGAVVYRSWFGGFAIIEIEKYGYVIAGKVLL